MLSAWMATRADVRKHVSAGAIVYTEILSNLDDLVRVRPEWNDLLRRARIAHPFLTQHWLECWWSAFGSKEDLRILVVRDQQGIIGAAPFKYGVHWVAGIPIRRLSLLTNEHSPRCDVVVDPTCEHAFQSLWDEILGMKWDVLELARLEEDSVTMTHIADLARRAGFHVGHWDGSVSPYLRIRVPKERYEESLARKHRANIRNRMARLARIGPVLVERTDAASLERDLEESFRLEAAAWKGVSRTAILCDERLKGFYAMLAQRAWCEGWLDLQFLKVGSKRIAFAYCLRYGSRLYILKQGYDPEYSAYSPSTLLQYQIIMNAFGDDTTEVDFLGDDDHWKRRWADEARLHRWAFVYANTVRGGLLYVLKFRLLPGLRRYRIYEPARRKLGQWWGG